MAQILWCNLCNRNVTPEKNFNWLLFFFGCGIPYLLYYTIFVKSGCPVCHARNFSPMRADELGKK